MLPLYVCTALWSLETLFLILPMVKWGWASSQYRVALRIRNKLVSCFVSSKALYTYIYIKLAKFIKIEAYYTSKYASIFMKHYRMSTNLYCKYMSAKYFMWFIMLEYYKLFKHLTRGYWLNKLCALCSGILKPWKPTSSHWKWVSSILPDVGKTAMYQRVWYSPTCISNYMETENN